MGSPIERVSFYLYRDDTNQIIQESIDLSYDKEENGIYTFSAVFDPTLNSSFGLDSNAFKVYVEALDSANNGDWLNDSRLPEGENPDNFCTKVRIKEKSEEGDRESFKPIITPIGWPDRCKTRDFEAKFSIQDTNTSNGKHFRPAGIDKNKLEIYVDGELQELSEEPSSYFKLTTSASSLGNDEIYELTYILSTIIDDTYAIKIKVWDNDGHVTEFEKDIVVNATAPAITLEPIERYIKENKFTIQGTVDSLATIRISITKDNIDLEPILINENELEYSNELGKYIYLKEFTDQEDGDYSIKVMAYDNDGVCSENLETNFTIDSKAPIFKSIKFYPIGSDVALDFEKGDTISGDLQYRIVVEVM